MNCMVSRPFADRDFSQGVQESELERLIRILDAKHFAERRSAEGPKLKGAFSPDAIQREEQKREAILRKVFEQRRLRRYRVRVVTPAPWKGLGFVKDSYYVYLPADDAWDLSHQARNLGLTILGKPELVDDGHRDARKPAGASGARSGKG